MVPSPVYNLYPYCGSGWRIGHQFALHQPTDGTSAGGRCPPSLAACPQGRGHPLSSSIGPIAEVHTPIPMVGMQHPLLCRVAPAGRSRRMALGFTIVVAAAVAGAAAVLSAFVVTAQPCVPPVAERRPYNVTFGVVAGEDRGEGAMDPPLVKNDDYYWLRDDARNATDVIAHLNAENAYANCSGAGEEALAKTVFNELVSRDQQDDVSVPIRSGGFIYYDRRMEGVTYRLYARRRILAGDLDGKMAWKEEELGSEEVVLNVSALAGDASYFSVSFEGVSPDHTLVAYAVDSTGGEVYEGRVRDIKTGEERPEDVLSDISSGLEWGLDNRTLFYATTDAAWRTNKVWRRTLRAHAEPGTTPAPAVDELLYTEDDQEYSAGFSVTESRRFLTVYSVSSDTSEVYLLDLKADAEARKAGTSPPRLTLVAPRSRGVQYSASHTGGDDLVLKTNADGATNYKLVATTVGASGSANWTDVVPYNESISFSSVHPFDRFAVLKYRRGGFTRLSVVAYANGNGWALNMSTAVELKMPEDAATVSVSGGTYGSRAFLFRYLSMTAPTETWAYDGVMHNRTLLKVNPVPNYNRSLYTSERWEVEATDGVSIPLSVVYRTDMRATAGTPQACHVYGYGSYGSPVNPYFSSTRVSLLDRGIVQVIAHVRGGGEFGAAWYEAARLGTKNVTFTDFIAAGRALVDRRVTTPAMMSYEGVSAGGLLAGAVLTMTPDLARAGVILKVPFVDVLVTMADPSIPLTAGEWLEWGNPNTRKGYDDISAYSPVDNVQPGTDYPPVLLTTGLTDRRVGYWEATKMAARLRDAASEGGKAGVVLRVDMAGGHFGSSARLAYWRQRSTELAWLLARHGKTE